MVNFCAVYSCSNKLSKEKEKSFHRIPKVVKNQGRDILKLSKQRTKKWFIAMKAKEKNETLQSFIELFCKRQADNLL